jgi:hypothetical protein
MTPGSDSGDTAFDKLEQGLASLVKGPEIKQEPAADGGGDQGAADAAAAAAGGDGKGVQAQSSARAFSKAVSELVDRIDSDTELSPDDSDNKKKEKFDESTYNKKMEKIKAFVGDKSINADSVVLTVRKSQGVVRESNEFLSKLYNAENNNLWYKPYEKEEIYTTISPDYRQILRKKYGEKLKEIRQVDQKIQQQQRKANEVSTELSKTTVLDERTPLLVKKVELTKSINKLQSARDSLADEII